MAEPITEVRPAPSPTSVAGGPAPGGAAAGRGEALEAALALLQALHEKGLLDFARAALDASGEIVRIAVDEASRPENVRALRTVVLLYELLTKVDPEALETALGRLGRGAAALQGELERGASLGLFGLLRLLRRSEVREALIAFLGILAAFQD
jgi:uncharacterized protein YjgD (DUF1641 family)